MEIKSTILPTNDADAIKVAKQVASLLQPSGIKFDSSWEMSKEDRKKKQDRQKKNDAPLEFRTIHRTQVQLPGQWYPEGEYEHSSAHMPFVTMKLFDQFILKTRSYAQQLLVELGNPFKFIADFVLPDDYKFTLPSTNTDMVLARLHPLETSYVNYWGILMMVSATKLQTLFDRHLLTYPYFLMSFAVEKFQHAQIAAIHNPDQIAKKIFDAAQGDVTDNRCIRKILNIWATEFAGCLLTFIDAVEALNGISQDQPDPTHFNAIVHGLSVHHAANVLNADDPIDVLLKKLNDWTMEENGVFSQASIVDQLSHSLLKAEEILLSTVRADESMRGRNSTLQHATWKTIPEEISKVLETAPPAERKAAIFTDSMTSTTFDFAFLKMPVTEAACMNFANSGMRIFDTHNPFATFVTKIYEKFAGQCFDGIALQKTRTLVSKIASENDIDKLIDLIGREQFPVVVKRPVVNDDEDGFEDEDGMTITWFRQNYIPRVIDVIPPPTPAPPPKTPNAIIIDPKQHVNVRSVPSKMKSRVKDPSDSRAMEQTTTEKPVVVSSRLVRSQSRTSLRNKHDDGSDTPRSAGSSRSSSPTGGPVPKQLLFTDEKQPMPGVEEEEPEDSMAELDLHSATPQRKSLMQLMHDVSTPRRGERTHEDHEQKDRGEHVHTWVVDHKLENKLNRIPVDLETLRTEFDIANLQIVNDSSLLRIDDTGDRRRVKIGECALVTGDGPIAKYVNQSLPVQIATALASYLPIEVTSAILDDDENTNNERMQMMMYFLHNRMQCTESSDRAAWFSASIASHAHPESARSCLSDLLGLKHSELVYHRNFELQKPENDDISNWKFNYHVQKLIDAMGMRQKHANSRFCLLQLNNVAGNTGKKPTLEDMRQVKRDICALNDANGTSIFPLCYIYTLNVRRRRRHHLENMKQKNVYRVIDSWHQLREQIHTEVHFMLVDLGYNIENPNSGRCLGTMPVRVCPMCGFAQLNEGMTPTHFENHMYVDEYQCVLGRYLSSPILEGDAKSNFYIQNIQKLNPIPRIEAIMHEFMKTDAWIALAGIVSRMGGNNAASPEEMREALDCLHDTLQEPIVLGQNEFLRQTTAAGNLTLDATQFLPEWSEKLSRQTTRVLQVLRLKNDSFKQNFVPNSLRNVHPDLPVQLQIHDADAMFGRQILFYEFCRFAIKVFLLNLPFSVFSDVEQDHDNMSIIERLMQMAACKPGHPEVDYCQDISARSAVRSRADERIKGAYTWKRAEHVPEEEKAPEPQQEQVADEDTSVVDVRLAQLREMFDVLGLRKPNGQPTDEEKKLAAADLRDFKRQLNQAFRKDEALRRRNEKLAKRQEAPPDEPRAAAAAVDAPPQRPAATAAVAAFNPFSEQGIASFNAMQELNRRSDEINRAAFDDYYHGVPEVAFYFQSQASHGMDDPL